MQFIMVLWITGILVAALVHWTARSQLNISYNQKRLARIIRFWCQRERFALVMILFHQSLTVTDIHLALK
jgi:hypothetical protein